MKKLSQVSGSRQDAAAVAAILMLVVMQLLITSIVLGSEVDQQTTVGVADLLRAFYAAEGRHQHGGE
jgi:hypothetical protein